MDLLVITEKQGFSWFKWQTTDLKYLCVPPSGVCDPLFLFTLFFLILWVRFVAGVGLMWWIQQTRGRIISVVSPQSFLTYFLYNFKWNYSIGVPTAVRLLIAFGSLLFTLLYQTCFGPAWTICACWFNILFYWSVGANATRHPRWHTLGYVQFPHPVVHT